MVTRTFLRTVILELTYIEYKHIIGSMIWSSFYIPCAAMVDRHAPTTSSTNLPMVLLCCTIGIECIAQPFIIKYDEGSCVVPNLRLQERDCWYNILLIHLHWCKCIWYHRVFSLERQCNQSARGNLKFECVRACVFAKMYICFNTLVNQTRCYVPSPKWRMHNVQSTDSCSRRARLCMAPARSQNIIIACTCSLCAECVYLFMSLKIYTIFLIRYLETLLLYTDGDNADSHKIFINVHSHR